MAKTLTGTVKCSISVTHSYTGTDGITANDPVTFTPSQGIATYQALASQGAIYHISGTLASASNVGIDLNAGLNDVYGSAQVFSQVMTIVVINTTATSGTFLRVFGGETGAGTAALSSIVSRQSGGFLLPGNGSFICLANKTTANQWDVVATTDQIGLSNSAGTADANYVIVLIGDKA